MARRIPKKQALANLKAALCANFDDAADFADTIMAPLREQAMNYYKGEPFGDEVDGRSQWIQTELRDTVQAVLPHLLRIFCSKTARPFDFIPRNKSDIAGAEAMSDYINYLLSVECDGYEMFQTLLRDALVIPGGAIAHWFYEPIDTVTYENYTGLDQSQAAFIADDPEIEIVEETITVKFEDDDHGLADHHLDHLDAMAAAGMPLPQPGDHMPADPAAPPLMGMPDGMQPDPTMTPEQATLMPGGAEVQIAMKVRRTVTGGRIRAEALPPETFVIDRRARTLDTAAYVARREIRTVSELVEMGFDIDLISEHAGGDEVTLTRGGGEEYARNIGLSMGQGATPVDPAQRRVLLVEHFIRHDLDNDNQSELLRCITVGSACELLTDPECVSEIPFSQFVIDPTPHTALHRSSMMEQVSDIQRAKSQIMRDVFDSLAMSIQPRMAVVEDQVNLSDAINLENGGIVRMKQPGMVQPLLVPFIGGDALNIIAYLDDTKAQRTGVSRQSQGLDADALQSTSAIAINNMTEAASARMEMIARTLAEVGFKKLARGLAKLVKRHQNKPKMVKLREKWIEIDPRSWTADLDCQIVAGIGRGDEAKRFTFLGQILQLQSSILTTYGPSNPIVSLSQYRNTLSDMSTLGGIPDSSRFFKEVDEAQLAQSQQQQDGQKPMDQVTAFMQAEQMKSQVTATNAAQKLALEAMKAQAEDDRIRDIAAQDYALKEAELRARYGAQVNAAALKAEVDRERAHIGGAVDMAKHLNPQAPPEAAAPPPGQM